MLFFRETSFQDLDALNTLLYQSKKYWGYDEEFMKIFMENFSVKPQEIKETIILESKKDSKILGFHCLHNQDNKAPFLENLFLEPSVIGLGLGRKLWENACTKAKNEGWNFFTLRVDPFAEPFYKHMGATRIDTGSSPCAPGYKIPIMRYVLNRGV